MRAAWLAACALAIALVVQLSLLNGLHLPGGGEPDLVLVLVAALAMAAGPVRGTIFGFAVGLCLDLAPPGSALVGQYALVFCLAGWAAGRLGPVALHSARHSAGLLATSLLAVVVAAAEIASVAVSKLAAPATVAFSQVRLVLPATIGYDLVLCPLVLALVMLGGSLFADRSPALQLAGASALSGAVRGSAGVPALKGTARSRRAVRRAGRVPDLHLGRDAAGASRSSVRHPAVRTTKLRPGHGVPGSASGLQRAHSRPAAPVHLRFAGGRRGDGAVGAGLAGGRAGQAARHPGLLAGTGRRFRPRGGEPGGSAAAPGLPVPGPRRRPPQPAIRFGGHPATTAAGARLLTGARRSATTSARAAAVPRLTFTSRPVPVVKRAPAVPKFRRTTPARTSGVVAGGALTDSALRARRQQATPQLRLSGRAPGMLGGTGRPLLRRPPGRIGKQPRFSYGKRSPLSLLAGNPVGRHLGGRWLARRRVGGRSGVWLIGKRNGGSR